MNTSQVKHRSLWQKYLPEWLRNYQKSNFSHDILAGIIVGVLVIPQSLGYAVLAGMPPIYGLYSSIVPVLVYAWIGASPVTALGPVAVTAMMASQALYPYAYLPTEQFVVLSAFFAFLVGGILWLASLFRLGWITQFISRGVSAGFLTGSAILIIFSQLKHMLALPMQGNSLPDYVISLSKSGQFPHLATAILGFIIFILLFVNKFYLKKLLSAICSQQAISIITKIFPLLVLVGCIVVSKQYHLEQVGIHVLGKIPEGLPHFVLPFSSYFVAMLTDLLPMAILVALIAFVSGSAVAGQYARMRQESFDSNQELKGVGWANMIGSFFQIFIVSTGMSRTVINADAGAKTPLASFVTVLVIVLALVMFGQYLSPLPYVVLSANIMVAMLSMVDLSTLRQALYHDRLDAIAFVGACLGVLFFGLNLGLVCGLFLSFAGLIWQSSHPHIAIVGQVGDSGHFRNAQRFQVTLYDGIVIIRIDEQLFYGNALSVRKFIDQALLKYPNTHHLLLMFSAVNKIDLTAQEMLINLNQDLSKQQISLHFSEVKGPVMDHIAGTDVIKKLSGQVFLTTQDAVCTLTSIDKNVEYYV